MNFLDFEINENITKRHTFYPVLAYPPNTSIYLPVGGVKSNLPLKKKKKKILILLKQRTEPGESPQMLSEWSLRQHGLDEILLGLSGELGLWICKFQKLEDSENER